MYPFWCFVGILAVGCTLAAFWEVPIVGSGHLSNSRLLVRRSIGRLANQESICRSQSAEGIPVLCIAPKLYTFNLNLEVPSQGAWLGGDRRATMPYDILLVLRLKFRAEGDPKALKP